MPFDPSQPFEPAADAKPAVDRPVVAAPGTSVSFDPSKPFDPAPSTLTVRPDAAPVASRAERFGTGLRDPLEGGAQLLAHAVPKTVRDAIDHLNNWIADKTGLVAKLPEGGIDAAEKQREASIQAARGGQTGVDWYRTAGNVASPLNYVGPTGEATLAKALLSGATSSVLQPETGDPDKFWSTKGKEALVGGAVGAGGQKAVQGLAGAIKPRFSPDVEKLLSEGVSLTPGQMAGGVIKRGEDALRSVPFLGEVIRGGQRKSVESFNEAAINRALQPVGEKLPPGVKAGHDAIAYAAGKLDERYENLLPKLKGEMDPTLKQEILGVATLGKNLPPGQQAQLGRILRDEVFARFTDAGVTSGRTVKDIESKLGLMAADFKRSDNYDVRTLGGAVSEIRASLKKMLDRVNPEHAGELAKINEGWSNLLRVQQASSYVGAKEGVFTPNQLLTAARSFDPSKRKAAFARGRATQQDLAEAARDVIPQTIADSGTTERALWAGLAGAGTGGALLHAPGIPIAAGAAALPYTRPGMTALRHWATAAPQTREAVAAPVRAATPYVSPAVAAIVRQFLQSQGQQ
jgi:hypothetical protein